MTEKKVKKKKKECVTITSHSQVRTRRELVTKSSLTAPVDPVTGQGAHSLFVGMLRQQASTKFKTLQYKPGGHEPV